MNCRETCFTDVKKSNPEKLIKTGKHPCFSYEAHHKYARMHLPVAPRCNIKCNYCSRKYDCANESRPGVTSTVLSPTSAQKKFIQVRNKIPRLSVVGIAGPGDALANWENTKETIKLIKKVDPEIIFCLSTNGLMLPDLAQKIVDLGVSHITVTVNCLDPRVGRKIYSYVSYKRMVYKGLEGAELLVNNQFQGIRQLVDEGVVVKANIVMIKDINTHHIPDTVKGLKKAGVFINNIMPLIPAFGSPFENYPQTSLDELDNMRNLCETDLKQMRHCRQCRADAVGLLGEDRSVEFMQTEKAISQ
ncbi:nitrogenase cofactor biosynthesis protein NifB [Candidatus Contubernalis alkaliaceticus]|uniref:nitrogenase cofactor biosynthesis protein NifB n=1 Tax=Candidatus Contubernalis alkaliaceticus TaxID=338645 RepID=UPI001F4BEDDD|nr:nitrogenase cofactor biosynthesis protein NifB [Candidatus Contubernalis alkalaceticus]UNC92661.1 nitrogenase cofactor biosynthesis protein NifB [Candidatus Contubernalis alkalaceticus]